MQNVYFVFVVVLFTETIIAFAKRIQSNENSNENKKRFYILISPLCFVYTQPQLIKMDPLFTKFKFTEARKTSKKLWVGAKLQKNYTRTHQAITEYALSQIMDIVDKVMCNTIFFCIFFSCKIQTKK